MELPALRLRKTGPADLELILHHRREMFREMGLVSSEADRLSREFFAGALAEGNYHGWFLEDPEGNVAAGAGVILLEYHPSPANPSLQRPWAANVYTEPRYRRRGLARQLMNVAIDWARDRGYANLFLHASDEGRPLYESLGFAATNEMRLKLH